MTNDKIKYVKKIEDFPDRELEERIRYGLEYDIPHKIRPVPFLGRSEQITEYVFDELIARCPMTEIKDQYRVIIRFIPDKFIPELKSLKLYFWDYEEEKIPISHEHLADKIYQEFKKTISPKDLLVKLEVAGRGEIFTTIRVGNYSLERFKPRLFKNL